MDNQDLYITQEVLIRNGVVINNGVVSYENIQNNALDVFLKEVYKAENIKYSKFFKMDILSKLGFLATELLLKDKVLNGPKESVGVIFSNSSASLDTDQNYYNTIKDKGNYFPSPAVFVYTLPNIVVGEICIKNGFKGENLFFVENTFNSSLLTLNTQMLFKQNKIETGIVGWVDIVDGKYEVYLVLVEKNQEGKEFSIQNLELSYH